MGRWTLEQLRHLRDLEAAITPDVSIHIIPISRGDRGEGYGSTILWDARLHRKGIMGPRSVSVDELIGAGVPEEDARRWVAQTEKAVSTLNRLYPVLVPAIESKVRAIEAAVPEALPAAE
ncbi:hypothetical protein M1O52_04855 [Dehalococcoidia bacterium]|nr:hypothetical protein [Dehalococcoidia bacterium]